MELKAQRRWQLQDVLHAAGEEGITQSVYDDQNGEDMRARINPRDPELKGKTTHLDINEKTGLPSSLSETERVHIFLAIRRNTRGQNQQLEWELPITCATQLATTLEDLQVHAEDDRRYRNVILRAQPLFQGLHAYDNVKVLVEEDDGRKLYFGKYVMINIAYLPVP